MSDEIKHECAVAMVVLRKPPCATADFGGTKLSLLLEKQHNRGQDGAGVAILSSNPEPGAAPYWIAKSASATPLADVLGMIGKRSGNVARDSWLATCGKGDCKPRTTNHEPPTTNYERIFLGHLRYATFGKNDVAYCHPFVHEASDLRHTLLLSGNFNLTNAPELFDEYRHHGSFPTSKSDGYLVCELIAHELKSVGRVEVEKGSCDSHRQDSDLPRAISTALKDADGAWTLCGATADGTAFATRDPHGIRPGFYYIDEDVVVVASERPAIQAAFDVPPEAVKELPPGKVLVITPEGEVWFEALDIQQPTTDNHCQTPNAECPSSKSIFRPCSFERIYFSRANDADIHRERKALGAALVPDILSAAKAPLEDIFFSYIPNSARIAFHGLLEELFKRCVLTQSRVTAAEAGLAFCSEPSRAKRVPRVAECAEISSNWGKAPDNLVNPVNPVQDNSATRRLCVKDFPRFGEIAVKDAKFRTFIADAAARREFYKHVYDVTYGLVRPGQDTLVVLDDSIVRGNTMKNAILPMLDRLGPKRIVIASSAPPIRYPDCYGIDMSTLGELVAFKALVNLLDGERGMGNGERELREALAESEHLHDSTCSTRLKSLNPLASLYARFTEKEHAAEIARLLTPPGMRAEVVVVYQTLDNLRRCLTTDLGHQTSETRPLASTTNHEPRATNHEIGDWYFTGDYPTPGGYKVLRKALENYLSKNSERSY